MSQTQDTSFDGQATEVDDLDVEGHGMREVALGLGAATIVASGAGAALAMDPGPNAPGTTAGAHGVVAAAEQAAHGAAGDVGTLAGSITETVGGTVNKGITAVDPIGQQATVLVADAHTTAQGGLDRAGQILDDPIGETDLMVDQAKHDVRELRNGAMITAQNTVRGAGSTVDSTKTQALAAAEHALTTAGNAAGDAVGTASDALDGATGAATQAADDAVVFATSTAGDVLGKDAGVQASHSGGTTSASVTAAGVTAKASVG